MTFLSIEELRTHFENALVSYIPRRERFSEVLYDSEKYSLKAGGKRIRPLLLLSTVQMLGESIEEAMPFAAALEFIHTYSLIHDDLPAMDNDDFRRGLPSNHKEFGEDIAILAGDGLLTAAFGIIAQALMKASTNQKEKAFLTICSGAYAMVKGQTADVSYDKTLESLSEDERAGLEDYILLNKTGALFSSSVMAGAYLGDASEEELSKLKEFSELFGKAFQIADDIGDFEKDEPVNFAKNNGLKKAKNDLIMLIESAEEIIDGFDNNENLKEFCGMLRSSV